MCAGDTVDCLNTIAHSKELKEFNVSQPERFTLLHDVTEAFGKNGGHWCCLGRDGEEKLSILVEQALKPFYASGKSRSPRIVEIGSHQGVSTCVLNRYGDVASYDIKKWDFRDKIVEKFKPINKFTMDFVTIPGETVEDGNKWLFQQLPNAEFDVAFIDGNHEYESVEVNFASVKHCSAVIFHDYSPQTLAHVRRTCRFVDGIIEGRTTKIPAFALWEKWPR